MAQTSQRRLLEPRDNFRARWRLLQVIRRNFETLRPPSAALTRWSAVNRRIYVSIREFLGQKSHRHSRPEGLETEICRILRLQRLLLHITISSGPWDGSQHCA